jgi:hypothetical protein
MASVGRMFDRQHLLWREAILEYYHVCHFSSINLEYYHVCHFFSIKKLQMEAAVFLYMKTGSCQKVFQQLDAACQEADGHSRRLHALDLSDVGMRRRATAVRLQLSSSASAPM